MSQINLPLDIESLALIAQSIDKNGNIILDVESKCSHSICQRCGKPATKPNGKAPPRLIRHLSILDTPVYLRITPRRYQCESCDDGPTTTEQYDWCARNASTTNALDDYLMRSLIHSTIEDVAKKEVIGSKVIQNVLDRKVGQGIDWSTVEDIDTLGLDEIAMKKGHQDFMTVISAKAQDRTTQVLGVVKGRLKEDVKTFLESIPVRLRQTVKTVCTDMYNGYVNAAIEVFGPQSLVIDRFHVAKLYRNPLDKLRISEMLRLKQELEPEEYAKLEGMIWILRRQHECLSEADKKKLVLLYKHSAKLKTAHQFALKLTNIFNTHCTRKSALAKIKRWIRKVEKNKIGIFDGFIKTLKKYLPYIGNYFKDRKNSGFVEGLNNKIKVAKRRCYGILKTKSLFQRLFLDLQGYETYA